MNRPLAIWVLCFVIFCCCFGDKDMAGSHWENVELYGGQIHTLAMGSMDSNLIFAGSWSGDGLFKTIDGGDHWTSIDYFRNSEVFSVVIGGNDQKTVWVAHNMFLSKSEDGGVSWNDCFLSDEERFAYCLVHHPLDSHTAYLGCGGPERSDSGGAIFKTTDGGNNWKKLPLIANHNVRSMAIRRDRPEEIWAITGRDYMDEGSIYKSVNGGESWTTIQTGLRKSWFDEIVLTDDKPPVIFTGGGNGVYRSNDGGESWAPLNIDGWPEDAWCRALALDPSDNHRVYAQCYSKFSISTDAGDHWKTTDLILDGAMFELLDLVVDPQKPDVMYGGDVNLGIIKSENHGTDWAFINQGIRASHTFETAIDPQNPDAIAASTLVGVYTKRDDTGWVALDYYPSYSLAFDPHDGATLFAGFDGWLGKFSPLGENATFQEFPEQTVTAIAMDPANPDILYLGSESFSLDTGEIHKSTDGGETWIHLLTRHAPINDIQVDPKDQHILYAGSGLLFAPVTLGHLYKSTDGGENWYKTTLGDMVINAIAIDPVHPEIVYAGTGAPGVDCARGVFKSVDRGNTWQYSSKGLPLDCTVVDIELDVDNPQLVYAATFEQGVFISRNGGGYWTLLGMSDYWAYDVASSSIDNHPTRMRTPPALPNRFYAGTASGLYQYSGAGTGMVIGMITESSTGKGITGAQVMADTGGVAKTEDGAYLLVTAAGGCTITASALGYSTASQHVAIPSGETVTNDLILTSLSEHGSITGTITDVSTEFPIEGGRVVADPGGYSIQSLAGGDYTLRDIVPGTYTLSAFKSGYGMDIIHGVIVSQGETTGVDFTLSSLGRGCMEGDVTDALSGEAMKGVTVWLDPGMVSTTTDVDGGYCMEDIVTGVYTAHVRQGGYLPYRKADVKVYGNERVTLNIELQPCPFHLLGLSNKVLNQLRRFRDEILLPSQSGKALVSLFYEYAPEISRSLITDPVFKRALLELLEMLMPQMESCLARKLVVFPTNLMMKAEECLIKFAQKDQPEKDANLCEFLAILHDGEILNQFGILSENQEPNERRRGDRAEKQNRPKEFSLFPAACKGEDDER